jgi:hypothetical protein
MIHPENPARRNLPATALAALLLVSVFNSTPAADGRGLFSNLRVLPQTGHEAHDAAQRAEADAKRNSDPKLKKFAAKLAADRAAARLTDSERPRRLRDSDAVWHGARSRGVSVARSSRC